MTAQIEISWSIITNHHFHTFLNPLLCSQAVEQKIQSMRTTVAEIQKCKPGLCLPEKAEETLTVFSVVDQLQTLLLELEKVS